MKKETRIKKEYNRIAKLYQNLPKAEWELLKPLAEQYAFMEIKLEEWQKELTNMTDVMQQKRLLGSYNTTMKSFTAVYKELKEKLPDGQDESKLSRFLSDE